MKRPSFASNKRPTDGRIILPQPRYRVTVTFDPMQGRCDVDCEPRGMAPLEAAALLNQVMGGLIQAGANANRMLIQPGGGKTDPFEEPPIDAIRNDSEVKETGDEASA